VGQTKIPKSHAPVSVKALALTLPTRAWKKVFWREGTHSKLQSRFAALRVRPAHRDFERSEPYPEEWLLIEWPREQTEPAKYWLSTLSVDTKLGDLVRLAKQRWIIERDYEELKQELGLGHYEGRGWRGFHHQPLSVSPPTGSWWPNGAVFPPLLAPVEWAYPSPKCHPSSALGARPVRAARHNPSSIATLRQTIARILVRQLSSCPFCGSPSL
jgi:hypothetical protein